MRCSACQERHATRRARDSYLGLRVYVCDRCPTPAEIRSQAAAIQTTWSERTRMKRRQNVGPELDEDE